MSYQNYKKILPRYNQIITTAEKYEEDQMAGNVIRDTKRLEKDYKTIQRIVSVGPNVRDLKPGDYIELNWGNGRYIELSDEFKKKNFSLAGLDPLARASHMNTEGVKIRYPIVKMEGVEYFLIYDDDVLFACIPE